MQATTPDPSSLSDLSEFEITHIHLDIEADFESQILFGSVVHSCSALVDELARITLDSSHVSVKNVFSVSKEDAQSTLKKTPLKFNIAERHAALGSAVTIELNAPLSKGHGIDIVIEFSTTSKCTAAQWLTSNQTVGKKHPYLFTQCQAIHARSLFPCADSPGNKQTYTANVTVPKELRALMSALNEGSTPVGDSKVRYQFRQPVRVPSYLIALAVGHLEGKDIGPRTTVWCEPELLDACAWEFVDTEKFVAIGEELLTPYEWGRYDLLILPPSFPYGGMENPCLTFVTPTLLAGDRSLVDVVAHEIAHSWCGNLVTNKDWQSFWLNEGFTMFVERKIIGRLHGEESRHFSAILGWRHLQEDIEHFGAGNPLTALCPVLNGVDPDDAFSGVPYEKGFNLLFHLETLLGIPTFEKYLKDYISVFAGQSINTQTWKMYLYEWVASNVGQDAVATLNEVDWDAWFNRPGMPPVVPEFDQTLAVACQTLADKWNAARNQNENELKTSFSAQDIESFLPLQKVVFLDKLIEQQPYSATVLKALGTIYSFSKARNAEIRFRYLQLCLKANFEESFTDTIDFITSQGRMKYVRPLYRALFKCKNGAELARSTFLKHKTFYHPICAAMIEKDLGLAGK